MRDITEIIKGQAEIDLGVEASGVEQSFSEASALPNPEMKYYIGVKLVQAKPMNLGEYNQYKGWVIPENENPETDGYLVKYEDDYISWCPRVNFEKHNFQIEKPDSISQSDVDLFLGLPNVFKFGEKTTLALFNLINGFEIIETSACVDPKKYDEKTGIEVCLSNAKNQTWKLLGFLLQCAKVGFSGIN